MDLNRPRAPDASEKMPLFPAQTLLEHVIVKGIQVGSVVGCVLTPAFAYKRGGIGRASIVVLPATTLLGVGASLGLLGLRYAQGKLDADGVDDRAYRIANSLGQHAVDASAFAFGCAGAATGAVLGVHGLRSVLAGGLAGVALGVGAHGLQLAAPLLEEKLAEHKPKR